MFRKFGCQIKVFLQQVIFDITCLQVASSTCASSQKYIKLFELNILTVENLCVRPNGRLDPEDFASERTDTLRQRTVVKWILFMSSRRWSCWGCLRQMVQVNEFKWNQSVSLYEKIVARATEEEGPASATTTTRPHTRNRSPQKHSGNAFMRLFVMRN